MLQEIDCLAVFLSSDGGQALNSVGGAPVVAVAVVTTPDSWSVFQASMAQTPRSPLELGRVEVAVDENIHWRWPGRP